MSGLSLFVDYAGQTSPAVDRETGEVRQARPLRARLVLESPWVEPSSGESGGQGFAGVIPGQLTGANVVAQAEGLLQPGVDVGGDTTVGMVAARADAVTDCSQPRSFHGLRADHG